MSPRPPRTRLRVPRRRPHRNTTAQLVLSVIALVGLLAFWHQLAGGAAGCFATLAGPGPQGSNPAASPPDAPGTPAPQAAPAHPTVRLRLPPSEPHTTGPDAQASPKADAGGAADVHTGSPTRAPGDAPAQSTR